MSTKQYIVSDPNTIFEVTKTESEHPNETITIYKVTCPGPWDMYLSGVSDAQFASLFKPLTQENETVTMTKAELKQMIDAAVREHQNRAYYRMMCEPEH